jgi:hypothetical protein
MAESYPFPVYSGVLEPEHYKRIGNALWLFLWCISATTEEVECEGVKWGQVLGRKPIKIQELQEVFGVKSDKTIRNWIEALETNGYIKVTRSPYGLIFEVNKSKKFRERSVENYRSGSVKDYRTEDRDRQKITDHSVKNYRSNKDITEDIYINSSIYLSSSSAHEENAKGDGVPSTEPNEAKISSFRQIEAKYIQRRARGFDLMPNDILVIEQLLQDGIPVDTIMQGIDKAFDEYKPRFKNDRIKSMTYCDPIIRELHYLNESRKEANERAKTRKSAGHGRDSQESGGSESDSKGYFERFDGLIQSL